MKKLRIDKFLKTSRVIKRRKVAKDALLLDRIYLNNNLVKPAKQVKIDDLITLHLGLKIITIKVTSLNPKDGDSMYQLISEEKRSSWPLFIY